MINRTKKYIQNFHIDKKWIIIFSSIFLVSSLIGFFFIAIIFYGDIHDLGKIVKFIFSGRLTHAKSYSEQAIARSVWIVLSMMIGGMGLAITGAVSQSLTNNSLADASTLGTINATIFLLVISFAIGWIAFYAQYIFALIGGAIAAALLLGIIVFAKGRLTKTKLILIGLSISIAFKAISFFFWSQDKGVGAAYSAYLLGGSEKIYGAQTYMPKPWLTLQISSGLIFLGTIITLINSKGMSVIELGESQAKGLGVSVKRVRVLNIISLVLLVPTSVLIVGNVAFIGLISTHVVRIFFRTRDYKKLIPLTALVGMSIALLGLLLNILVPKMNSSIWTTIIGAPLLIYLGWKRL